MFNNNYTKKPTRGLVASYPLDWNANASVWTNVQQQIYYGLKQIKVINHNVEVLIELVVM